MRGLHLALSLCFLSSVAKADMTGNDLKDYCSFYPQHTEKTALCMGYIGGTLDMVHGVDKSLKVRTACEPASVTGDQLIAMVIKYLDDHPEQLHLVAASLIWNMYTKAFPCPKQ